MSTTNIPTIRWGIIATGLISSWFVEDLALVRHDAKAHHVIQAIGSSSIPKGEAFAKKHIPNSSPTIYGSYEEVYADPSVDVVYIGTPHAFHKQNCLDAIAAGKPVLCEKAFTLNSREAQEVFHAAKEKGVYVHEAMWLRHRPLVKKLRKLLYEEKVIGDVFRMSSDFGTDVDIPNLPPSSRHKDLSLGAGTVLNIGIYSLTWAILALDPGSPQQSETPRVAAFQTFQGDIEVTSSIILHYPSSGRQGVITSTSMSVMASQVVCRIDGTNGHIEVEGPTPSLPLSFTVYPKTTRDPKNGDIQRSEGKLYSFEKVGKGFIYEADDTALDIAARKMESDIMPWAETLRVLELTDEVRRQGGTRYPQEEEF